MTVRGRLSQLPKGVVKQEKEIMHLYYDLGIKQKEIKDRLDLDSVSVVAEVLRRDAVNRVEEFKELNPNSEGYQEKAVEIIDKIDKIAITASNSTNVKPFLLFIFVLLLC